MWRIMEKFCPFLLHRICNGEKQFNSTWKRDEFIPLVHMAPQLRLFENGKLAEYDIQCQYATIPLQEHSSQFIDEASSDESV